MTTEERTPSRSTWVAEKRDLKGKLYFIKDLLYEKAFDREGFWQVLPNSSFYPILQSKNLENLFFFDELELVAKKKINRPKWTTTKSATNKTQSFSEFFKRKDTTHMFLTKDLIHLICKRLA